MYLYAGFDKTVKILKTKEGKNKNYDIEHKIFFEKLPIHQAKFSFDSSKIILSFLKKPFISIFDIKKQKSDSIYKLFPQNLRVQFMRVNEERDRSLVVSKNHSTLIDTTRSILIDKTLHPAKILDSCLFNENKVAINYNNFKIRFFDTRKNLKIPYQEIKENCKIVRACGNRVALGKGNGIVRLFENF